MEIKDGDSKQLPQSSVPAYIHLALGQLASHEALPYAGNISAFVRDATYLLMLIYAETLEEFDLDDEHSVLAQHVLRREESFRREVYIESIGIAQIADLGALAQVMELATLAGDTERVHVLFRQVFHHVDNLPPGVWQHQFIMFIAGIPEFREALELLDRNFKWHLDNEVQGWVSRIEVIDAERDNK